MNMGEGAMCDKADRQSEFDEIVGKFDCELKRMSISSDKISDKLIKLRDFREPECELKKPCADNYVSDGIIGRLVDMITQMSRYNDSLIRSSNGLERFVG